jgi:hypothetical protein
MTIRKKLPIGIQTFENLILEGYTYVDKTNFVLDLALEAKYFFLSRPRRFGKSLLVSTLKAAFEGKRELFQGLYLYDHWDWEQTNPVIHISLGSGVMRSVEELQDTFSYLLDKHERIHGIQSGYADLKNRFADLIQQTHAKYDRPVVVLIDEYDKPILDSIHRTETAVAIREELKNYYSVLKDADPYLRLVFITGVSKFSKVSLFSGLNNLEDLTVRPEFSTICGYTRPELERDFAPWLSGVDLEEVMRWYNGYSWLGEKVCNPFDILLFLRTKTFSNHWFETATPTFLIRLLEAGNYPVPELNELKVSESILGSFDIDRIEIETLLFQTGYLTIKSLEILGGMRRYTLGYPNQEVRQSLADYILGYFTNTVIERSRNAFSLYEALEANDFERLHGVFHAFFASIPYDWYAKNQAAKYEAYYASIVYCYFAATGVEVQPQLHTNRGRLDLVVRFKDRVYLIEFKVVELCGPGQAMEQMQAKGYAEQFAGQEVYLLGVEFSSLERNIVRFDWKRVE